MEMSVDLNGHIENFNYPPVNKMNKMRNMKYIYLM